MVRRPIQAIGRVRDRRRRMNLSAVDDLKTYEKFAQAHVDGLKNLISAFTSLYDTMPDAQKKVADKVFDTSKRGADTAAPGKQG
jgi:hypothetical protein